MLKTYLVFLAGIILGSQPPIAEPVDKPDNEAVYNSSTPVQIESKESIEPIIDTSRPNIVFVMADQWRADATGYSGNDDVLTPNLDKISRQSIVFSNALSSNPVCSPARASLLTGQYPLTHGLFYNDKPLATEALTIAEIYKSLGYATGYVGKWHVNGHPKGADFNEWRKKPIPRQRRQGFDYWKVAEVAHQYNNSAYFDENDIRHHWTGYDAFPQTDSAIGFISQNRDRPFLLILSWGPPHSPYFTAPKKFKDWYDPSTIRVRPNVPQHLHDTAAIVYANYYAHCSALDEAIGKLDQALDSLGVVKNTIFIFTSDHGDMLFSHGLVNKQVPWEESVKVPFLLRYPAMPGSKNVTVNFPFSTIDVLPTLLGLSGVDIPSSIEGADISGVLTGKSGKYPEAALIQFPVPFHQWNFLNGGKEYRAIKTERYTYARDLKGSWLLYDNIQDPYQLINLAGKKKYQELESKMSSILSGLLSCANDQFRDADFYMRKWNYDYDMEDDKR